METKMNNMSMTDLSNKYCLNFSLYNVNLYLERNTNYLFLFETVVLTVYFNKHKQLKILYLLSINIKIKF